MPLCKELAYLVTRMILQAARNCTISQLLFALFGQIIFASKNNKCSIRFFSPELVSEEPNYWMNLAFLEKNISRENSYIQRE